MRALDQFTIDSLGDEMIAILLQRIAVSKLIMHAKPPEQIVDSRREEEIFSRYTEGLAEVSNPAKVTAMPRACSPFMIVVPMASLKPHLIPAGIWTVKRRKTAHSFDGAPTNGSIGSKFAR